MLLLSESQRAKIYFITLFKRYKKGEDTDIANDFYNNLYLSELGGYIDGDFELWCNDCLKFGTKQELILFLRVFLNKNYLYILSNIDVGETMDEISCFVFHCHLGFIMHKVYHNLTEQVNLLHL